MLQITYRHMTVSETLRAVAEEKYAKIQSHFQEPARCHLVVECCAGHARRNDQFHAHAALTVNQLDLHLDATAAHEDAATAVRKVFEHMERQIASRNGRSTAARRVG